MPTIDQKQARDPRNFVREHCQRAVDMHLDGIEQLARLAGVNESNAHLFTLVSHVDGTKQELFFGGIHGSAKVGEVDSGYRQTPSGGIEFFVNVSHSPITVSQLKLAREKAE